MKRNRTMDISADFFSEPIARPAEASYIASPTNLVEIITDVHNYFWDLCFEMDPVLKNTFLSIITPQVRLILL